jgi:dihydroorotase
MKVVTIRKPDDMHLHLREGQMLAKVLPFTSEVFTRGVVMGNLSVPIVTARDAERYREEILKVDSSFKPIMAIMLTRRTSRQIIQEAFERGFKVLKYIPGSASTNSEEGLPITELKNYYHVLELAQKLGMIFLGHWESPFDGAGIPVPELEREVQAIPFLEEVVRTFPRLKVVAEHASTETMIEWVKNAPDNIGATLTVHHALLTYGDVCRSDGGVYNPHHYCKPIVKTPGDRCSVVAAMISGNPKFFFGSDSAPHPLSAKEKTPPSAGIFTAPVALPLLLELFERNNAVHRLNDFVSRFGAEFYGLSLNEGKVFLKKESGTIPEFAGEARIFNGGQRISWQIDK